MGRFFFFLVARTSYFIATVPFFFLSRLGLSFKKLTCVCVCYSSLSYAAAEVTTENKTKEDPL